MQAHRTGHIFYRCLLSKIIDEKISVKRIIIIILYLKRLSYNYRFPSSFHYGVGGSILYINIFTLS